MDTKLFIEAKNKGFNIKKRKSLTIKKNNNSADFIAPNFSHGCEVGCSYCIAKGTMIRTPNGEIPVEQIQNNNVVFAFNSETKQLVKARVQGTASRQVKELLEIEVEGALIKVSLEHPFLTQRGWVEARNLLETDKLLCI